MRIAGDTSPGMTRVPPQVGIDYQGAAQLYYLGKTKAYWLRWSGGEPAQKEMPEGAPLALSVQEEGNATAMWIDDNNATASTQPVLSNTFDVTRDTWDTPKQFTLTSDAGRTAGHARHPTTNPDCWFVAWFIDYQPPLQPPLAARLRAYSGRGRNVIAASTLTFEEPQFASDFIVDNAGNLQAIALAGNDAARSHLYYSESAVDATEWTKPKLISSRFAGDYGVTHVSDGHPTVVWHEPNQDGDSGAGRIVASRHRGKDSWSEPETIAENILLADSGVFTEANSAGKIVLVWEQNQANSSAPRGLFSSQFIPDLGWSKPAPIATYSGSVELVGLTTAENGSAMLVYLATGPGSSTHDLVWSLAH
jgi:hypothetical protein